MIKVQYKINTLPKVKRKYKYIIVHDISCMFPDFNVSDKDNKKSKISTLRAYNLLFHKQYELNYHYFCEFVNNDYESFIARPLNKLCEYNDISDIYQNGIHVCIMGNFQFETPVQRSYQQIGYRVLAPMMFYFGIPISNIVTHKQISLNKDLKCPGDNFDFDKLIDNTRTFILK